MNTLKLEGEASLMSDDFLSSARQTIRSRMGAQSSTSKSRTTGLLPANSAQLQHMFVQKSYAKILSPNDAELRRRIEIIENDFIYYMNNFTNEGRTELIKRLTAMRVKLNER